MINKTETIKLILAGLILWPGSKGWAANYLGGEAAMPPRLPAEYQEALNLPEAGSHATNANTRMGINEIDGRSKRAARHITGYAESIDNIDAEDKAKKNSEDGASKEDVTEERRWLNQRVDRLEQRWRYLSEQDWGALIDNLQQRIRRLNGLVEQQSYQIEQLRLKVEELSNQRAKNAEGQGSYRSQDADNLPEVIALPPVMRNEQGVR